MPDPSTPRRRDLNYVSLNDFTTGIVDRVVSTASVFGNSTMPTSSAGAAQADNTWGCIGLPGGGLGPGPRVIPLAASGGFTPGAGTFIDSRIYGGGIYAAGPFVTSDSGGQSSFAPEDLEASFWCASLLHNTAGPTTDVIAEIMINRPWETIIDQGGALSSGVSQQLNGAFIPGWSFVEMQSIRTADSDITVQGYPFVGAFMNTILRNLVADTSYHISSVIFPDIDTSSGNTDTPKTSASFAAGSGFPVQHQGRLVFGFNPARSWGLNGIDPSLCALKYSDVNDIFSTYHDLIINDFGSDGIYSMYSVNSSELLIIRGRGGALSIRGDLSNPTIVRYPGVQSAEGVRTVGCNSPLGYIYGSRSGVYAWKGGDESIDLSPQLMGPFWLSQDSLDNMNRRTIHGSFAYSNPYIFAPNNYMYDTRTKGWWRYSPIGGITEEAPANPQLPASGFGFHSAGPYSGDVYAQAWSDAYTGSGNDYRLCVRVAKQLQTCHYKYTSQPLPWTVRRIVSVRDLVLVARGVGTVTITLTSAIAPLGSKSKIFTINSATNPVRIPADSFEFQGSDIIVTIESNSGVTTTPAPTVWSVDFGLAARESLPNG